MSEHYKKGKIQPIDYIEANGLDFNEGNVVKYVTRWKYKGTPLDDLYKTRYYVNRLIEIEEKRKAAEKLAVLGEYMNSFDPPITEEEMAEAEAAFMSEGVVVDLPQLPTSPEVFQKAWDRFRDLYKKTR